MGVLLRFLGQTLYVFAVFTACRALDCHSEQDLLESAENCVYQRWRTAESQDQRQSSWSPVDELDFFCRDKGAFIDVLECVFDIGNRCIKVISEEMELDIDDNVLDVILPSHDQFLNFRDYWCDNWQDFDVECVESRSYSIEKCADIMIPELLSQPFMVWWMLASMHSPTSYFSSGNYKVALCKILPVVNVCGEMFVKQCPGKTWEVMKGFLTMLTPPSCDPLVEKDEASDELATFRKKTKRSEL